MQYSILNERILELPLFQGMSRNDLEQILANTRFSILSYAKGKTVINENDVCDKLYFLVKGTVTATGHADDNGYSITECLPATEILQPERIFGLTQRYTHTVKALTDCTFISLSKIEIMTLSDKYEIFRLNLLNMICTRSQRLTHFPWRAKPKDVRKKIARFIENRCIRPAGEKFICIRMERLGEEINESRLKVSRELNAMRDEGIISLRRSEIHVYALERIN